MIPSLTLEVAQMAFPKGNKYMALATGLAHSLSMMAFVPSMPQSATQRRPNFAGTSDPAPIYGRPQRPSSGRSSAGTHRLEILTRSRTTDPGFHDSVLSEFREPLLAQEAENTLLGGLLNRFQEEGWLIPSIFPVCLTGFLTCLAPFLALSISLLFLLPYPHHPETLPPF